MIRQQLFIAGALVAGVAIGFFVRPEGELAKAPAAAESKKAASAPIADRGEAATIDALRARVRELEARLAKSAVPTAAVARADAPEGPRPEAGNGRRPGGPREWMERLKKENPARYAQMTNHFARMRQERQQRAEARASFLLSVDTSRMSARSRQTHDEYLNLMEQREALEEKLRDESLTENERRQTFDEMRALDRSLREASGNERQMLLGEIAKSVGIEGEAAEDLTAAVQDVIEATDSRPRMMGPPPPAP